MHKTKQKTENRSQMLGEIEEVIKVRLGEIEEVIKVRLGKARKKRTLIL
jgi:hypothetical protein